MSNKREPLLSDEQMRGMVTCGLEYVDEIRMVGAVRVNGWHEAARAKDAELIQMAVDMAHSRAYEWTDPEFRAALMDTELAFLAAAEAVGFKPSSQ